MDKRCCWWRSEGNTRCSQLAWWRLWWRKWCCCMGNWGSRKAFFSTSSIGGWWLPSSSARRCCSCRKWWWCCWWASSCCASCNCCNLCCWWGLRWPPVGATVVITGAPFRSLLLAQTRGTSIRTSQCISKIVAFHRGDFIVLYWPFFLGILCSLCRYFSHAFVGTCLCRLFCLKHFPLSHNPQLILSLFVLTLVES